MDLRTPGPYWLLKNGFERSYPVCSESLRTDVAVIGAGITGSLTAYALTSAGIEVTVIEKRHPGMGSTSASTALLQYEIDEPLHSLIPLAGRKRAQDAYQACYAAVDTVADIIKKEGIRAEYQKVPSLQYATYKKDVEALRKEHQARKELGFDVRLLEPDEIKDRFGFSAPLALYSTQAAQVDAYRLAHGLLGLELPNLQVYDCSEVTEIETRGSGVQLILKNGCTVKARKAVIACGYESLKYLPFSIASIGTTYALVTKPVPNEMLWEDRTLIWETKDPYLYLRTAGDGRLLGGGRDDEHHNPRKIPSALPRKIEALMRDLTRLFPQLPLHVDFSWAGAFASTKDALGYVGGIPQLSNVYFNLGFGGNGILYSQIGAEIIRDEIIGRKHPYRNVFEFGR